MKRLLIKAVAIIALATLMPLTANAGSGGYCAPSKNTTCELDCCPNSCGGGSVTLGYDTDYIFYGVRLARDNFWADLNYTFEGFPVPVTVGAYHITTLDSAASFDETDLYASVELGGLFGFTTNVGYIHRFFSNVRGPSPAGVNGDSFGEIFLQIERDLLGGTLFYRRGYFLQASNAVTALGNNNVDGGAWIHTLGFDKSICLTDCVSLNLGAGVLYSDNLFTTQATALDGTTDRQNSAGWNSYYIKAGADISLNCRATLSPYIGYNGAPDGWIADGVVFPGSNNDALHGGVSLNVTF